MELILDEQDAVVFADALLELGAVSVDVADMPDEFGALLDKGIEDHLS